MDHSELTPQEPCRVGLAPPHTVQGAGRLGDLSQGLQAAGPKGSGSVLGPRHTCSVVRASLSSQYWGRLSLEWSVPRRTQPGVGLNQEWSVRGGEGVVGQDGLSLDGEAVWFRFHMTT